MTGNIRPLPVGLVAFESRESGSASTTPRTGLKASAGGINHFFPKEDITNVTPQETQFTAEQKSGDKYYEATTMVGLIITFSFWDKWQ